jgi:flavin reductase (DIM6/NTAB) family NADH-FMN oxidoreductase RutF/rubredoxin
MIHFEALFKLSYGLYIVSSGDNDRANGFISNSVFQVTAEPPQFASCCNKNNYTSDFIQKTGFFSLSVLHQEASSEIIGRFGYKSGRDINKMEGMSLQYGIHGTPIVLNDAIAICVCKVVQTIDVGTHWLFIGELIHAELLDEHKEPLTYAYYRHVKKGLAPKNAPTYIDVSKMNTVKEISGLKRYKCTACGYIYEEGLGCDELQIKAGTKFEDVPDDFLCPVCGAEKEDFILD